jgi:hypothetical protein
VATVRTLGTVSTQSGYEYYPRYSLTPGKHIFVAADGRAIVIYMRPLGGTWYVEAWASNAARDSWGAAQGIWSKASSNVSSQLFKISACKDGADNIYVTWIFYNSGTSQSEAYFVKLTKQGGGGWSIGSINNFWTGTFDGFGYTRSLDISFDPTYGRIWIGFGKDTQNNHSYSLYTSTNGGASLGLSLFVDTPLDNNYLGLQLVSFGGLTFFVVLQTSGTYQILCYVINNLTLGGSTVLWSGGSQVPNNWSREDNYGYHPLYIGNATVDFVIISVLGDGTVRLKKYKNGWLGEVTVFASGATSQNCRCYWDADSQKLIIWKDGASAPWSWNPANDAITATNLETIAHTICQYKIFNNWHGFSAGGSSGTSTLTYTEANAIDGEMFDFIIGCTSRKLANFDTVLAVDGRELLLVDANIPMFSAPTNFFMLERTFGSLAREVIEINAIIPTALKSNYVSVQFDYVIAAAAQELNKFEAVIATYANSLELWHKEADLADSWAKEGSVPDSWTKESIIPGSWSKE